MVPCQSFYNRWMNRRWLNALERRGLGLLLAQECGVLPGRVQCSWCAARRRELRESRGVGERNGKNAQSPPSGRGPVGAEDGYSSIAHRIGFRIW